MTRGPLLVLVVAAALTAFGWWGCNTAAGRQRFDEMAGIIPTASLFLGLLSGAGAILWLIVSAWRARGQA